MTQRSVVSSPQFDACRLSVRLPPSETSSHYADFPLLIFSLEVTGHAHLCGVFRTFKSAPNP